MKKVLFTIAFLCFCFTLSAQLDSIVSKLKFNADFRFRVEQDWDSRKQDGTFRDDRTRLRYRLRAGVTYADKWYEAGFRIRTGLLNKQQDPQLTLGEGFEEFGTLPIGFEKAYFQGKIDDFTFWIGKNTFPFEKSNELFWSDNVYPEGVMIGKSFDVKSKLINTLDVRAAHFIMSANGRGLDVDAYVQGVQAYTRFGNNRYELFPSFYAFKNVPNIPDGNDTFELDYAILQVGTRVNLSQSPELNMEFDYYYNVQDYNKNDSIPSNFKNQKTGVVAGLKYGAFQEKGDWLFKACYAYLEQYSAVDIMAQNDWARWDYSQFGSLDGRLTNLQGIELTAGFKLQKNINLITKFYLVEQLVPYGITKETGSRIRFDIDIYF